MARSGPDLVEHLLYEKEDSGILWIRFNRPDRMNALYGGAQEQSTVTKLGEYMRAGDDDPDVRVIVLTGVGRGFCVGADLKSKPTEAEVGPLVAGAASDRDEPDGSRQFFFHGFTRLQRDIAQIRKPTIAMVNGPAIGAGFDLALHCDLRTGSEKTLFRAYAGAGQIFENGGAYYLPKMVGLGRALELAYTDEIAAEQAHEWGILNHLVPSGDLEAFTRDLCRQIIEKPPLVQWISKRIMRAALDSSMETTMVMTSNAGGILHDSEDAGEARAAFKEKRKPQFKGR